MGAYDLILKQLVEPGRSMFLRMVAGKDIAEPLDPDVSRLRERHADVLVRLVDMSILHIEFQTRTDPAMEWRMLDYNMEVHHRFGDVEKPKFDPVRQILISPNKVTFQKEQVAAQFSGMNIVYEAYSLAGMCNGGSVLFRSRYPRDWVFGLLCMPFGKNGVDPVAYEATWRDAVRRIWNLPAGHRQDALTFLQVAAAYRPISEDLKEEINSMPFEVDAAQDSPLLRQAIDHGYDHGRNDERIDRALFFIGTGQPDEDSHLSAALAHFSADEFDQIFRLIKDGEPFEDVRRLVVTKRAYRYDPGPG